MHLKNSLRIETSSQKSQRSPTDLVVVTHDFFVQKMRNAIQVNVSVIQDPRPAQILHCVGTEVRHVVATLNLFNRYYWCLDLPTRIICLKN